MQIKRALIYVAVMSFAVYALSACSQDEAHSVDSVEEPDEQGLQCGNNQVICNGICVHLEDDPDHCGKCGNKCSELADSGVAEWGCRKNACFAQACKAHYHLKDGACIEDDVFHCAGTDCTTLPGWESGYCDDTGLCVAETCLEGFVLNTDDTPYCEEHVQDCGEDASVCVLPEGASEMSCVEGKCAISECDTELYHWNTEHTACVKNSIQECGAPFVDCTNYIGWNTEDEGNICGLNEDGVVSCIAASCLPGYHVYGGLNAPCELDDHEHCGEHGHVCEPSQVCTEGKCQIECGDDLKDCSGTCVDLANNFENCGSCGHSCTLSSVSGADALTCEDGICKVKTCVEGYHLYEDLCENDDIANCGAHGKSCVIEHADSVKCDHGLCGVEKCASGYHIYSNSCEVDNNEHCGTHEIVCSGSTNCIKGQCACASGTDCGGSCVDTNTDANHCGGCNHNCGSGKKCSGGKCVCASGTDCGGKCVDINTDANHCGGCNHNCGSGKKCSGGKCVCASGTDCGGKCVDVNHDTNNCGFCGNSCHLANANYGCSGGSCWHSCYSGYVDQGWKCEDETVACPAGTTGADCSSCKAGYTQCGMSGGYPLCLKIGGVISPLACVDYCNHAPGWGGHWTNGKGDYYVTRCSAGQTCYLASFAIGGYVQCY